MIKSFKKFTLCLFILIICSFNLNVKADDININQIYKPNKSGVEIGFSLMPNAQVNRNANMFICNSNNNTCINRSFDNTDNANAIGLKLGYRFSNLSQVDYKVYLLSNNIKVGNSGDGEISYGLINFEAIIKLNSYGGIAIALGLGSVSYKEPNTPKQNGSASRFALGYNHSFINGLQLSALFNNYNASIDNFSFNLDDFTTNIKNFKINTTGLELGIGYIF